VPPEGVVLKGRSSPHRGRFWSDPQWPVLYRPVTAWLRSKVTFVPDPGNRVAHIDMSKDWWYVDDLAEYYMRLAGKADLFQEHVGGRVCAADPAGDGSDVLKWLALTAL
jgi:hypothetical protein